MNTTDFLNISAAICPDRDAIVFEGKRHTFGQLSERTNRLAHTLADLGIAKGDRVAMLQVNCNQHIEVYFATAKLGAIYVPLNFRAKGEELAYMLNSCEPKALFVGDHTDHDLEGARSAGLDAVDVAALATLRELQVP